MRIRQIKPQFFMDKDMASLSWRQRVTYIGLWLVADDAGWFVCDYEDIARELYGFDAWKIRERWMLEDIAVLQERGQIEVADCGHALIPTFVEHQRFSGPTRRVYTVQREHEARCLPHRSADPRGDTRVPAAGTGTGNRNGREQEQVGNGTVDAREARHDGEPSEFQKLVPRPTVISGGR